MSNEYEKKIEIKQNEYILHLDQLQLHSQSHIQSINTKINQLQQEKIHLQTEHEQQLNQLIKNKQNSINEYLKEKNNNYKQIQIQDQFIKNQIQYLKFNQNKQNQFNKDLYERNIELIHLAFRNKLKDIKNKFSQVNLY